MLYENERENHDINNIGASLKSRVEVKYNLKSLMRSEFVYD